MSLLESYMAILEAGGGASDELTPQSRWKLEKQWRRVYAAGLHAATGKWVWKGFGWHVFSYGYANAIRREKAIAAYDRQQTSELIVIPDAHSYPALPAFRVVGGKGPDFQGSSLDVTLWPEDLAWTMAFTHEDGDYGPYFSRREWLAV